MNTHNTIVISQEGDDTSLIKFIDRRTDKMADNFCNFKNINRLSKVIKDAEGELKEAGITFEKKMCFNSDMLRALKGRGIKPVITFG